MKIGILTYNGTQDNYGQVLQCYALQKYLRELGHEPFLIRYNHLVDIKPTPLIRKIFNIFHPRKIYGWIISLCSKNKSGGDNKTIDRKFDEFRKQYITSSEDFYPSYNSLKNNPPQADIYIVGSDQVWNFFSDTERRKRRLHAYFLDFGLENVKRMSYAASWGRTEISDNDKNEIIPLLKRFSYVSVREESGLELCAKCGRNDAELVCAPTLLLSADDYRSLYLQIVNIKPSTKYVLLYMLKNECDFNIKTVYDFARKKNLEVIYITGNLAVADGYHIYYATIPEWLYFIDNAEYIITNSFHCGVFSTIFHKQFGIVPLTGSFKGMNARIDSLFKLRGTGKRYIADSDFEVLDKEYNVNEVNFSERFLKEL